MEFVYSALGNSYCCVETIDETPSCLFVNSEVSSLQLPKAPDAGRNMASGTRQNKGGSEWLTGGGTSAGNRAFTTSSSKWRRGLRAKSPATWAGRRWAGWFKWRRHPDPGPRLRTRERGP